MKEDLVIIAKLSEGEGALLKNSTYFAGRITNEMLKGSEFEGSQIIYCNGWSGEPLTLIKTESIRPLITIHVKE